MSTDDEIKMQNEEQQRQQERHQSMIDGDQDQADGVPPQRPQREQKPQACQITEAQGGYEAGNADQVQDDAGTQAEAQQQEDTTSNEPSTGAAWFESLRQQRDAGLAAREQSHSQGEAER